MRSAGRIFASCKITFCILLLLLLLRNTYPGAILIRSHRAMIPLHFTYLFLALSTRSVRCLSISVILSQFAMRESVCRKSYLSEEILLQPGTPDLIRTPSLLTTNGPKASSLMPSELISTLGASVTFVGAGRRGTDVGCDGSMVLKRMILACLVTSAV